MRSPLLTFIILLLLLLTSNTSIASTIDQEASEVTPLFSCPIPQDFSDPKYIQGSDLYLYIAFNHKTKKVSFLSYSENQGEYQTLFSEGENTGYNFAVNESFLYFEWALKKEKFYISIVYLGSKRWGSAIKLNSEVVARDIRLEKYTDLELYCNESIDLIEFIKGVNNQVLTPPFRFPN